MYRFGVILTLYFSLTTTFDGTAAFAPAAPAPRSTATATGVTPAALMSFERLITPTFPAPGPPARAPSRRAPWFPAVRAPYGPPPGSDMGSGPHIPACTCDRRAR